MTKLERLIAKLCPNGVEYASIDDVCSDLLVGGDLPENYAKGQKKPSEEFPYPIYSNGIEENALYGYTDGYRVEKESVTISARGTIGYHTIRNGKFTPIVRLITLIANESKITTKFLNYSLSVAGLEGITISIPSLTLPMLKKFKIPVPPLPIQREIVRILDNFTELTAELTTELTARKKQYDYYRNELLTFGDNVPVGTLGEILEPKGYIRGPFGSALKKEFFVKDGTPIYEQQHAIYDNRVFRYFIDDERARGLKRFFVKPNDLIISCSGTIGKISIIRQNDLLGVINQALLILRLDLSKVLIEYVKYYLECFTGLIVCSAGGAITNIEKREVIEIIKIPIPTLEEQARIVAILDHFDALTSDITSGLPAEIAARQKQYEVLQG